jgi:hypothetical protein
LSVQFAQDFIARTDKETWTVWASSTVMMCCFFATCAEIAPGNMQRYFSKMYANNVAI